MWAPIGSNFARVVLGISAGAFDVKCADWCLGFYREIADAADGLATFKGFDCGLLLNRCSWITSIFPIG